MLDIYKLNSVSSDELVAGIVLFNSIAQSEQELPKSALDFYELFYLVQTRTPASSVEKFHFELLKGYASYYEENIMYEIMQYGGMYDDSLENECSAYQLFHLSEYFIKNNSEEREYWEIIREDMKETIYFKYSN